MQKLELSKATSKYLKNTLWMFSEQFVKLFSIFIVNIFIARYLGPEQFGVLSFSVGVIAVALTLSRLGMESVLVRELIENANKASVYVGTAFALILLAGIFCSISLLFMLNVFGVAAELTQFILLLSISLIPQAFLVLEYHFQSQTRAKYSSLAKSLALMVSAIIKLALVFNQAHIFSILLAILVESILIAAFLLYIYQKKQQALFSFQFDKVIAAKLLRSSFPMLMASLTTVLYMRIDQFMIKALIGDFELGVYAAVSKMYELWVMVAVVLSTSLLPAIVRLKNKSINEYESAMVLLFRGVILISVLVAALSTIFAENVIEMLFGDAFALGVTPFVILMWASVFAAMGSVTVRYLTVEKVEKKVAQRAFLALSLNIVSNTALIPLYGVSGAAISTLFSLVIANYMIDFMDKDVKKLWSLKNQAIFIKTI